MDNEAIEYFAFAESVELLQDYLFKDVLPEDHELKGLDGARMELGLAKPTHVAWLDCIEADYFYELEWTTRRLDDSSPAARRERRQNLRELDDDRMVVMQVLFSAFDQQEKSQLASLGRAQWHHVVRTPDGLLPASIGGSYSLMDDGGAIQLIDYRAEASDDALERLYNVFNVDFIEEMQGTNFNEPEPPGGGQPINPGGDGGAPEEQEVEYEEEEELEAEESEEDHQIYMTRMS